MTTYLLTYYSKCFSMNNTEILTENSQSVFIFMALCLDLISQDIASKRHILHEIIFGIDDSEKKKYYARKQRKEPRVEEKTRAAGEKRTEDPKSLVTAVKPTVSPQVGNITLVR